MAKLIQKEKTIQLGKEPVVILSLTKWRKIEGSLEDLEDSLRFNAAYKETRKQKTVSLDELKRKYKL